MTLTRLESYLCGAWVYGSGEPSVLRNPTTEEPLAETATAGLDFAAARRYAVERGGPALRALSFAQRGAMLRALSKAIHAHRDELLDACVANGGNTRSDAKFDVDGAAGTLAAYADLAAPLGEGRFFADGDAVSLGRSSRVAGQHVLVPRRGLALHLNAYNFPAWGIAEKAAVALLAGVPVLTKPATPTALPAYRLLQVLIATGALPDGALQFLAGDPHSVVDALETQDVLAFTGSQRTGAMLRGRADLLARGVRVNVEADSVNAAILCDDVAPDSDVFTLFVADVLRDLTQKAGQKCTAIRRVFVPRARLDAVREALLERLGEVKVGAPDYEGVTVGPLPTATQLAVVRAGIARLVAEGATVLAGGPERVEGLGAPPGKGYFVAPTVLLVDAPASARAVHEHEVFGPVLTLLPYDDAASLGPLVARGGGGLVCTVYSDDRGRAGALALELAPWHGRVCLASSKVQGAWLGPGTVLPSLVHGGPGRAGGGEELGGLRGLALYLQRTALQGYGPWLEALVADARKLPGA